MYKELIANLLTEMIMKGATEDEIIRVCRFSINLMDALKTHGINELYEKYCEEKSK